MKPLAAAALLVVGGTVCAQATPVGLWRSIAIGPFGRTQTWVRVD